MVRNARSTLISGTLEKRDLKRALYRKPVRREDDAMYSFIGGPPFQCPAMSYPVLRANEHWDRSSKTKFKRQDMRSDMFGPLNQDPALGRDEFYFRFARPKIVVVTVSGHLARKNRWCDNSDEAKLGFRVVLIAREYGHKRAKNEDGGDVPVSPENIGEYVSLKSNGTCTLYKLPPLEARFEMAEDGEGRCRGITVPAPELLGHASMLTWEK